MNTALFSIFAAMMLTSFQVLSFEIEGGTAAANIPTIPDTSNCEWAEHLRAEVDLGSIVKQSDRVKYLLDKPKEIQSTAEILAQEYLEGRIEFSSIDRCLKSTNRDNEFVWALQSKMRDLTLAKLREHGGLKLRQLMAELPEGNGLIVQLKGHRLGPPPAPFKAGARLDRNEAFFDMRALSRAEWYFYFVHELIHLADDPRFSSIEKFFNKEAKSKVDSVSQTQVDPLKLSLADKKVLIDWLDAGLNMGLLAEYRAWGVGLLLYLENRDWWGEFPIAEKMIKHIGLPKNPWPELIYVLNYFSLPTSNIMIIENELAIRALPLRVEGLVRNPPTFGEFDYLFN